MKFKKEKRLQIVISNQCMKCMRIKIFSWMLLYVCLSAINALIYCFSWLGIHASHLPNEHLMHLNLSVQYESESVAQSNTSLCDPHVL